MDINELYTIYLQHPSVVTDTRKISRGDIFFALKGPNFNGNHYVEQALKAGASYCVIDEGSRTGNSKVIFVNDVLDTLQQLAKKHRSQFNIPFIAITGSNGKTTTKELIHAVLCAKYRTYTTEGNLNNHIGIPVTILRIRKDAEFAVIEMGANHLYEIRDYCSYVNPTHGLITNCGKAHIEGFGSEENVRKGKGELFDHLRSNNGTAFVWNDDPCLIKMSKNIVHVISYGSTSSDHRGEVASDHTFLEVSMNKGLTIKTNLIGGYNLPNVMAAVAVGRTFHIDDETIRNALENYVPSNSRSQLMEKDSNKIILDAYNANPSSMKVAIENFANMPGNKKILMLGGMKELGPDSIAEHNAIIDLIKKYRWQHVLLVGKDYTNLPSGFIHFKSSDEAREWFRSQNITESMILIKGSRGMQMEKVLE
jgi:UDP-N-acetylmuramoyl-tripeptide--D-alanyl-D-alanine ligase